MEGHEINENLPYRDNEPLNSMDNEFVDIGSDENPNLHLNWKENLILITRKMKKIVIIMLMIANNCSPT